VQRPHRSTFYAGLGLVGTDVVHQSGGPETLDPGGGLTAWLGVHLNDRLSLEVGWMGSFHNPAEVASAWGTEPDYLVLEGVTADARLHLAPAAGRIDPYVQGGVGVYFLGSEHLGIDSVGTGFQLGGGVDFWIAPSMTLGLRAVYHGIAMGPPDGGDSDTFINAVTFEGGVGVHF
jgi:opacity protein-like surface antigen